MTLLGFDRSDAIFIYNMWRISMAERYLGSALGGLWAILNPLIMFLLFTFVFAFVFKARLPGVDTTTAYAMWMICGYGPWLANAEALTSSSNSIIGNAGLVKNMAFKTEVLPISATMIGIVPLVVSLVFILGLQIFSGKGLSWSLVWLPVIIFVQFLFLASIGMMVAAFTTFVRDFGIVLPNLLLIVLFATPIFYPLETIPLTMQKVTAYNPIYIISTAYRSVLLDHQTPHFLALLCLGGISYFMMTYSLSIFRRIKGFFPAII